MTLAERIFEYLDSYEIADNGATVESLAADIETDPRGVLEYLNRVFCPADVADILFDDDAKMLADYYPDYDTDDENIIINGNSYPIEINMSVLTDDRQASRININGEYFYF